MGRIASPPRWWKPGLAVLTGLAGLGVAAAWFWPRPGFTPRPAPVAQALVPKPVALAPGVYLLGKTSPAAAYAVETADGLVLVDSGLEDGAAVVAGQLAELGFDVGQVRAVLLTHAHADHSLGAQSLRARTGAKVYAGRGDVPPLRDGGPRVAFFSTFQMPDVEPHPTTVDVELAGGEAIEFGDARFTVLATPGHTPGSVCYLLERPGLRALFTGDVVQHLSTATPDALGTYVAYLPPLYRGDARDYLASLRKLRALPTPDLVLPGHPRMDVPPQDPRMPAADWHALLDRGIAELETVLARYAADGADFLDGSPKELLPGLHYLGDVGRSAVYALDTPKGLFLFDAPGGPALVDHLAARFTALGWSGKKPTAVFLTSADEAATAGLAPLVRRYGCQVVAPKAGREQVRKLCPPGTTVVTADDPGAADWFGARAIPLAGRGVEPVAYRFPWAGKAVLVSGRIPARLASAEAAMQLSQEVLASPGGPVGYLASLDRLAREAPDLWLPAVPVHGQNANLYDDAWAKVIRLNRELFR